MGKRSRTPVFFDRENVKSIVKLIYEGLPIEKEDATIGRSMEVYDRIQLAYNDLAWHCRTRELSGSGTTVATAVAIFCLAVGLSDAQFYAYKPIYGGRKITGVFYNDVYHLLKDNDLRMINYSGVRECINWCLDNHIRADSLKLICRDVPGCLRHPL